MNFELIPVVAYQLDGRIAWKGGEMTPEQLWESELSRKQLLKLAGIGGALASVPSLGLLSSQNALAASTATKPIDELDWGLAGVVASLDTMKPIDIFTFNCLSLGYESLLGFTPAGRLRPALATRFKQVDAKTYVFTLRRGVRFWDGSPVTADDVAYSLARHLKKGSGSTLLYLVDTVRSVRATGANEVTVKLKAPNATFIYAAALPSWWVIKREYAERAGAKIGSPSAMGMGTGPYQFTKFAPNSQLTAERFSGYWGPTPAVAKVNVRFIAQNQTRLLATRSGDLDGSFIVPLNEVRRWDSVSGFGVQTASDLSITFITMDVTAEPWSDIHVRRAVAHSVDTRGLIKAAVGGNAEAASAIPPPAQWGGLRSASAARTVYRSFPRYRFDMAQARAELAKSGYKDGFSAKFSVDAAGGYITDIALNLSQNMKRIGVDIEVEGLPQAAWFDRLFAKKESSGLSAITYTPDFPDPSDYLVLMLASSSAVPGGYNIANFKNKQVDGLLAQQRRASSNAVRAKLITQAARIAQDQVPYVPLWWGETAMSIKDDLRYAGFSGWYTVEPWAARISRRAG